MVNSFTTILSFRGSPFAFEEIMKNFGMFGEIEKKLCGISELVFRQYIYISIYTFQEEEERLTASHQITSHHITSLTSHFHLEDE